MSLCEESIAYCYNLTSKGDTLEKLLEADWFNTVAVIVLIIIALGIWWWVLHLKGEKK